MSRFPPDHIHELQVRTVGGEPPNMATLAPKLGPLGMPPKRVADTIQAATKDWMGLKITCKLFIQNRQPRVECVPSAAGLLIKALKEPVRDRKKDKNILHDGNLSMDSILAVARQMRPKSASRTFAGTVTEVLGTANSLGCTVDDQKPKDLQAQIKSGDLVVPDQ